MSKAKINSSFGRESKSAVHSPAKPQRTGVRSGVFPRATGAGTTRPARTMDYGKKLAIAGVRGKKMY